MSVFTWKKSDYRRGSSYVAQEDPYVLHIIPTGTVHVNDYHVILEDCDTWEGSSYRIMSDVQIYAHYGIVLSDDVAESPLSYEEWLEFNEEEIGIRLSEEGAKNELDYDSTLENALMELYDKYVEDYKQKK